MDTAPFCLLSFVTGLFIGWMIWCRDNITHNHTHHYHGTDAADWWKRNAENEDDG